MIAQQVKVTRPSAFLVVIAQQVEGEVRTLLDWRGAWPSGSGSASWPG